MSAYCSKVPGNATGIIDFSSELSSANLKLKLIFITVAIALHASFFFAVMYSPIQQSEAKPAKQFVSAVLLSASVPQQSAQEISKNVPSNMSAKLVEQTTLTEALPERAQPSNPSQNIPVLTKPVTTQTKVTPRQIKKTDGNPHQISQNKSTAIESALTVASPASAQAEGESIAAPAMLEPGVHCPKPEYPKASRRLLEEGVVTLKFLVDTDGHVLKAEIAKSSGFERLDDAARIALSKCQFRPGSTNGLPVQSWSSIRYAWQLK